ncbi:MAG: hypothetical protein ACRCY9_11095, partial [Phycicoccus sp.]
IPSIGHLKPGRGLILDWRRDRRTVEALVVWHDDTALHPSVKMDWLKRDDLIPVPVDPNWTGHPTRHR